MKSVLSGQRSSAQLSPNKRPRGEVSTSTITSGSTGGVPDPSTTSSGVDGRDTRGDTGSAGVAAEVDEEARGGEVVADLLSSEISLSASSKCTVVAESRGWACPP